MLTTNRRTFAKSAALVGVGAATGIFHSTAIKTNTAAAAGADHRAAPPLAPPEKEAVKVKMPELPSKKLGWAIVGLGQLAIEEILPAFGSCKISRPVAFVSGHRDKASHLAKVFGVDERAIYGYDNFDAIADDKSIDVVYIVLPNSMHAEYTVRALTAGKHVLCEKPMATSVEDCRRMIAAAEAAKRKLGVAYRLHYEPLNVKAAELCKEGAVGKIKTIQASNCQDTKAPNIRLSGSLGGGPVGDVGIYCINGACWVTGEQPKFVSAVAHWPKDDPRFSEVPESVSFTLEFPSGVQASCECGFGSTVSRRYRITGDKGFVEMDPAYAYRGLELRVKRGDDEQGTAEVATLAIPQKNHFAEEMDAFSRAILEDQEPRTSGAMGLADVRTVAAVMEAATSGKRIEVV